MSHRFFSDKPIAGERATLHGPEAHHLVHVMRAGVGDSVTLFDNTGDEFTAQIENCSRSSVTLRIGERRSVDRELGFALIVGVALPKGDRQKWLIEKLTELGVTSLVPLATTRGVAQPVASALQRLERAVIEAAKQCGRNRLMHITPAHSWSDWIGSATLAENAVPSSGESTPDSPVRRLMAHPGGVAISEIDLAIPRTTQLAIGPEGGLTEEEAAAATAAGWQLVDLGPRILRVESAAVALTAAVVLSAQ